MRVVISAGPTREAIDPVRFISNRSTGRMGYALAAASVARGFETVLVSGPVALTPPDGLFRLVRVESAAEMADAMKREGAEADLIIMCAAVADYRPKNVAPLKMKKQVHFYSNRDLLNHVNEAYAKENGSNKPFDWGDLFCELFKPGKELQSRMNAIKKSIGGDYYAAVFRFQNLLGDFHEYHFKALNDKEKEEKLITTCLDAIKKLIAEHGNRPLLVTADSTTFLKRAAQIDGVHIIPGTLIHMDGQKHYDTANQHETHLKSFLDFYMLSGAQKIYRIGTKQMYRSQFPVYAAKVHDIPFESIEI